MIDSHLHLWELGCGWHGWNTSALGAVHADSGIGDIADEMTSAEVTGAVVVQAADTPDETEWLLAQARDEPRILGVVGYVPLTDVGEVERLVSSYAGRPLVGVRQLWHDHERADELTDARTLTGLRVLGDVGLAVDVPDAFPQLWPALTKAVDLAPKTWFVLDHCGKPPFGHPDAWRTWEASFTDLATRPNVIVKLSGLFGGSGSATAATDGELARVVELTRAVVGADRTMIGSDWPMSRDRLGYAATVEKLAALLSRWSPDERSAATRGTATTIYGLGDSVSLAQRIPLKDGTTHPVLDP